MTTIHTCSYSCERPECIRAQRDDLAARLATNATAPVQALRDEVAEVITHAERMGYMVDTGVTIDLLRRVQAALAQQPEAPAQAWRSPDEIPEVVSGGIAYLWVAVRRGHNGRVYGFPAAYLNAVPLNRDDLDPIEGQERGNHWKNEPPGEHDECAMLATGWHKAQEHSEYDGFYSPLLGAADELVAWRAVANYPGAEAPQPAIPEGMIPPPRNRSEAASLAKLALAYLGVIDAHIDAAIARAETDAQTTKEPDHG